jgi:hypothetical protein
MGDIVDRLREVAGIETGLLYSRRTMLKEAADLITALREEAEDKGKVLDAIEIEHGLTSKGNLWRFWCDKATRSSLKFRDLHDQIAAKDAEIAKLREALSEAVKHLEGEPEYHDQGMGCGLEDRGITDRYDAMYHGWERAMERVYGENIAWAKDTLSAALAKAGEA